MNAVNRPDVLARFWSKVNKTGSCWLWTGEAPKNHAGLAYGRFYFDGSRMQAHRFAYEVENGPIPAGLVLDHACRTTLCVNPAHLEPTTNRENILRGIGCAAKCARKTKCLRGHSDFRINRNGWRECATCKKESDMRSNRARNAALAALRLARGS